MPSRNASCSRKATRANPSLIFGRARPQHARRDEGAPSFIPRNKVESLLSAKSNGNFFPPMKLFCANLLFLTMSILVAIGANPRREVLRALPLPPAGPTPKPTPEIVAALPNYNEETATRLQIFLDNND